MNIDRSRFLVLTAALAAATSAVGCTIIDERGKDDGAVPDTGTIADTGTTIDTAPGTDSGADTSDASVDSSADATADGAADADAEVGPTCDDTVGSPKACSAITGTGCSFLVDGLCSDYRTNLKPKLAQEAIDCLIALPTCEATGIDIEKCGRDALADACPDPTANTLCQGWKDTCEKNLTPVSSTFTVEGCALQINGLTSPARDAVTTCFVTEGGCGTTSIEDCIRGL